MKQSLTKLSSGFQPRLEPSAVAISVPPLAAVLADVKSAFFGLCVQTGQEVLSAMMEADRVALCGVKGRPDAGRRAVRGGHTRSWVTLGGRQVALQRPRARSLVGEELPLQSFCWAAQTDPLRQASLAAIAAGVSMRRYADTLDPLPKTQMQRSVSKSAVSRRFVALSTARLHEWMSRPLNQLDLPVILVDGVHFRDRIVLIALGIDHQGGKHVLGLREGSTENAAVVRGLVSDLVERGVNGERMRLWVIDGAKALRRAIRDCFGDSALIQRCQVHKLRNVVDHLPETLHASVRRAMRDAWTSRDPALGLRQLERLANSLEREHPGAAGSLREGLEETFTVQRLGIDGALARTLKSTNAIENLNGTIAHHTRNVRRWRDGQMLLRWIGAALHEAQHGFRRLRGYRDMRELCAALERHRDAPSTIPARKAA